MSKTRIVIIQLKEIIYTAIFVGLGILLILLLVFMFAPDKDDSASLDAEKQYTAGVYTSMVTLNDTALNVEVVVDEDNINSLRIVNIDESITTMYPLLEPSLEKIAKQLYSGVDINDIELSEDSKYTQTLLLDAVKATLNKAVVEQE
ncbi:hypothetical protein EDD66_11460 [Mobilisporobacter senegalensis]|uniref:FMN-binding protein n=1 Tax=Mobilisporobacter senegalensis TaxID=1329262 RepID=A0A3N1X9P1_9FIRM|nr:hypothetical protein EDD66_11460 [Mobilisporobacter senegalensis]